MARAAGRLLGRFTFGDSQLSGTPSGVINVAGSAIARALPGRWRRARRALCGWRGRRSARGARGTWSSPSSVAGPVVAGDVAARAAVRRPGPARTGRSRALSSRALIPGPGWLAVLTHQSRNDSGGGSGRSLVRVQPDSGGGAPRLTNRISGASLSASVQRRRPLIACGRRRERGVLHLVALRLHDVVAKLDEHGRDVDLDRADLVAGAAQRRRERQLGSACSTPTSCGVRIAPIGPG